MIELKREKRELELALGAATAATTAEAEKAARLERRILLVEERWSSAEDRLASMCWDKASGEEPGEAEAAAAARERELVTLSKGLQTQVWSTEHSTLILDSAQQFQGPCFL